MNKYDLKKIRESLANFSSDPSNFVDPNEALKVVSDESHDSLFLSFKEMWNDIPDEKLSLIISQYFEKNLPSDDQMVD